LTSILALQSYQLQVAVQQKVASLKEGHAARPARSLSWLMLSSLWDQGQKLKTKRSKRKGPGSEHASLSGEPESPIFLKWLQHSLKITMENSLLHFPEHVYPLCPCFIFPLGLPGALW
jgi:hypothetical protein